MGIGLMRGADRKPDHRYPVPVANDRRRDESALTVPISMYIDSMASVECPELTSPGAQMTVFRGHTLKEAEEARALSLKAAKKSGSLTMKEANRQRWASGLNI